MSRPVIALTQGDPAGIGPELLLRLFSRSQPSESRSTLGTGPGEGSAADQLTDFDWQPLLLAERSALTVLQPLLPEVPWERLIFLSSPPDRAQLDAAGDALLVYDPVVHQRTVSPGLSGAEDAAGAMAALDAGVELARSGVADALVTAPISKASIARHHLPGFVGHTEYLAAACGLEAYGRDYLMAFLAPQLQVALLSTHLPLRGAVERVRREAVLDALLCLGRNVGGRIAVAGLNPHAGEGGLLGDEDDRELLPAVAEARAQGVDAHGPESADSLFARAIQGSFDWVLALYHDQGLIAVKTARPGTATNWTLGLPFLRTSVDHGTAFDIAGRGVADVGPLRNAVAATLRLIAGDLPARRSI